MEMEPIAAVLCPSEPGRSQIQSSGSVRQARYYLRIIIPTAVVLRPK